MIPGTETLNPEEVKAEVQKLVEEKKAEVMSEEEKKKAAESKASQVEAEKEAATKKAKDDELLAKPESERTPEDSEKIKAIEEARKVVESKREEEEESKLSVEEKIKKVKESAQKRIDEVINKMKQQEDSQSKENQELKAELETLRREKEVLNSPVDVKEKLHQQEQERINKYIEEDKDKPLQERREMSDDDLQEWLIDDYVKAQRWLARQEVRRERERDTDINLFKSTEALNLSRQRAEKRHPELVKATQRAEELAAAGKTSQEIEKTILEEFPKMKVVGEIFKAHPEFLKMSNGPDLLADELDRRMKVNPEDTAKDEAIDALTKQIEEMSAKLARMESGDVGINSTVQVTPNVTAKLTEMETMLVETMKSANAPQEAIDKALEKFKANKGKR